MDNDRGHFKKLLHVLFDENYTSNGKKKNK